MVNGKMSAPLKSICNHLAWIERLETNIKLPLSRLPVNEKEENITKSVVITV